MTSHNRGLENERTQAREREREVCDARYVITVRIIRMTQHSHAILALICRCRLFTVDLID